VALSSYTGLRASRLPAGPASTRADGLLRCRLTERLPWSHYRRRREGSGDRKKDTSRDLLRPSVPVEHIRWYWGLAYPSRVQVGV